MFNVSTSWFDREFQITSHLSIQRHLESPSSFNAGRKCSIPNSISIERVRAPSVWARLRLICLIQNAFCTSARELNAEYRHLFTAVFVDTAVFGSLRSTGSFSGGDRSVRRRLLQQAATCFLLLFFRRRVVNYYAFVCTYRRLGIPCDKRNLCVLFTTRCPVAVLFRMWPRCHIVSSTSEVAKHFRSSFRFDRPLSRAVRPNRPFTQFRVRLRPVGPSTFHSRLSAIRLTIGCAGFYHPRI